VSARERYDLPAVADGPRVAVVDYGVKRSLLALLVSAGASVSVFPHDVGAGPLLGFDAVVLSSGPGDPEPLTREVATVRDLLGRVPVFGVCLGHQLLALANGLETFKLRFGHRGANHPVKELASGRIEITSQNHGFAVLGPDGTRTIDTDAAVRWETDFGAAELTHINLYDRTVEGLVLRDVQGATVQYHPEAGPGPNDALHLFDRFVTEIAATAAAN
jgi:carbamoyl-phosphate synthase small subunit